MAVSRFEDLIAWQKARVMAREIYRLTEGEGFRRDFGLLDQMRRSAVSVMSNIAEGFERGGSREFCRFLTIAKASCAELRSQLYLALDVGHISRDRFDDTVLITEEVSKIISGLRASAAAR